MSLFGPVSPRHAGVVFEVRFHNRDGRGAVTVSDLVVDLAEGEPEGVSQSPADDRYVVTRPRAFSSNELSALWDGGFPWSLMGLGADRPWRSPGRLWSAGRLL
jgi:hypothetical protein